MVAASDAGHLLDSGLLEGTVGAKKRMALRTRLMAPDMLASAGLRTKSVGSPRFNPGSYHNGSVWPMDTGRIAEGLRRHGFVAEAEDLEERILHACGSVGALVEFFRGDVDADIRINRQTVDVKVLGTWRRVEQEPQKTQGWTVTRLWRIMRRRGLL
jgi:glycogen debranching enzyme